MRPAARWVVAYVLILGGAALAGEFTPLGPGNAVFLAGAIAMLVSLLDIRLGGPNAIVGRTARGLPLFAPDAARRRVEIRRGVRIFLLGAALWAALILVRIARFP